MAFDANTVFICLYVNKVLMKAKEVLRKKHVYENMHVKKYMYIVMFCSQLTSVFASTSKFNIVSVVTQTQMQRMGLKPFSESMFVLVLTQY